jgi:hypothetical protein
VTALGDLRRDVVVAACAISAGIHAALVPEHLAESTAAGTGFLVSAVALGGVAVAVARSGSALAPAAAALLFAGLIAAYVLATTTGVPVLQPEPEAVDGLALGTKAIEVAGILAAVGAVSGRSRPRRIPLLLAVVVAAFSATVALALSGEHMHGGHEHGHSHHDAHQVDTTP